METKDYHEQLDLNFLRCTLEREMRENKILSEFRSKVINFIMTDKESFKDKLKILGNGDESFVYGYYECIDDIIDLLTDVIEEKLFYE